MTYIMTGAVGNGRPEVVAMGDAALTKTDCLAVEPIWGGTSANQNYEDGERWDGLS